MDLILGLDSPLLDYMSMGVMGLVLVGGAFSIIKSHFKGWMK